MKIINYARQSISKKDIYSVSKVLKSDFLTQGDLSVKFAHKLKKISKANYANLFNSATSALHASCLALGMNKNKLLWTSPNSFVSSATCGLMCGGRVDFVDINEKTFNLDPEKIEHKIKKTKIKPDILVAVHFAGLPCDMKEINFLSKKYNFKIIEDASHALGSSYFGHQTGSSKFSDITVFSFHPVKIITTGEGGCAMTNSSELSKRLQLISNQGIERSAKLFKNKKNKNYNWYYEMQSLGYNYRLSDINSALGLSQLDKYQKFINKRKKIFDYYKSHITNEDLNLQYIPKNIKSSYHLAVVNFKRKMSKKNIFNKFLAKKIKLQSHYIPIHLHPYFKKMGFKKKNFPVAEKYYENSFSLPIYYDLNKRDLHRILKTFNSIFS